MKNAKNDGLVKEVCTMDAKEFRSALVNLVDTVRENPEAFATLYRGESRLQTVRETEILHFILAHRDCLKR